VYFCLAFVTPDIHIFSPFDRFSDSVRAPRGSRWTRAFKKHLRRFLFPMESIVKDKLAPVLKWYHSTSYDLCLIVLKSTNDCAIVYTVKNGFLEPSYVQQGRLTECSFLDKAVLTADIKNGTEVHFRVPFTTETLHCIQDSTGNHAIMTVEESPSGPVWHRVDILYADLETPKAAKISAYGTMVSGEAWKRTVEMDLSHWI
jgi:hypothetical protein